MHEPSYAYSEEQMLAGIRDYQQERQSAITRTPDPAESAEMQIEAPSDPDRQRWQLAVAESSATVDRLARQIAELRSLESDLAEKLDQAVEVEQKTLRVHAAAQRPSVRRIVTLVCVHFDIAEWELRAHDRTRSLCRARYAAMFLLRKQVGLSYPAIGRVMGMHHTSILHGFDRALALQHTDPAFAAALAQLSVENSTAMLRKSALRSEPAEISERRIA